MRTQKSKNIKKNKKSSSKVKRKSTERKKAGSSHKCLQSRTSQLENYKMFLQYLLSDDLDHELIDG